MKRHKKKSGHGKRKKAEKRQERRMREKKDINNILK